MRNFRGLVKSASRARFSSKAWVGSDVPENPMKNSVFNLAVRCNSHFILKSLILELDYWWKDTVAIAF